MSQLSVSVPELASLFSFTSRSDCVFWIRNAEYDKQLYVSEQYDRLWERPHAILYDNPDSWFDSIVQDDLQRTQTEVYQQWKGIQQSSCEILYRICTPSGEIRWMKDVSIKLVNSEGTLIVHSGVNEEIPQQLWLDSVEGQCSFNQDNDVKSLLKHDIVIVLKRELHLSATKKFSKPHAVDVTAPVQFFVDTKWGQVEISPREAETLFYLLDGKTAKETAEILKLSRRTVETYLQSLRQKVGADNKVTILRNIDVNQFLCRYEQILTE